MKKKTLYRFTVWEVIFTRPFSLELKHQWTEVGGTKAKLNTFSRRAKRTWDVYYRLKFRCIIYIHDGILESPGQNWFTFSLSMFPQDGSPSPICVWSHGFSISSRCWAVIPWVFVSVKIGSWRSKKINMQYVPFTIWITGIVNSSKTGDKLEALPAKSPQEEGAGTHTSSGRIHRNHGPDLVGISRWANSYSCAVMSCWGSTPSRTFFFILFNSSATHDECPTPSPGMGEPL